MSQGCRFTLLVRAKKIIWKSNKNMSSVRLSIIYIYIYRGQIRRYSSFNLTLLQSAAVRVNEDSVTNNFDGATPGIICINKFRR